MLKTHRCLVTLFSVFLLSSFFPPSQIKTFAEVRYKIYEQVRGTIFDLVDACRTGDVETAKRLLAEGVNVNDRPGKSDTPLVMAARMGNLELVQLLLAKGADIDSRGNQDATPLLRAAGSGHLKVVKFLMSKGAEINARNIRGESPLMEASRQGRLEVVKLLLEKGANTRFSDHDGQTAFTDACHSGHSAVAKLLLEHDPGLRPQQDQLNEVFIDFDVRRENAREMMDFMLELGADINAKSKDKLGWTRLINTSANGKVGAVRQLLKRGAKINVTDNYGNTALMHAAKYGKIEVLKILLENGAKLEQKNFSGDTALMLAKDEETAKLIKSSGAKAPIILTPENFDLLHSLPYDKRLARGLELTFRQYFRLFTRRPGALISVKTSSARLDAEHYKITYQVNIQGESETYEVILSNQAKDVHKNLGALRKVLADFTESKKNLRRKFKHRQSDYDTLQDELAGLIYHFDYTDLFKALKLIDQHLTSGKSGPKILLSAAEVYSWLAFFKNWNRNRHLSDALVSYGVCNYLLSCLQKTSEERRSFSEGLLLLSLDYPKAAMESFKKTSDIERLLTAYIKYDFEAFKSFNSNPLINKRLLSYLEARAYNSSGQIGVAQSLFEKMTLNYPDFLMSKEYVVDNAGVGFSRRLMQPYFEELLEKHFDVLEKFTETEWIKQDKKFDLFIRREVTEENRLSKWLKIHKVLVNRTSMLKDFSAVIEADFLKHFLLEDMANAVVIYHYLESEKLGREAETASIIEMVESVYPDSSLSRVLILKSDKDKTRILQMMRNTNMGSESKYLIRTAIESRAISPREKFELLNTYREMENPDSMGFYRMYELHRDLFYHPIAVRCLKEGIAVNPYNYVFYDEAFNTKEGRLYIEQGKKYAGEQYGFLTALGDWYNKNGNENEAVSTFKDAINKGPHQNFAYKKLGYIYYHKKQYQKAIEIWQEYLKYDDRTLSAVDIKNTIGKTWLEMDENAKAYDIFMDSKKSWQASALIGFAEASEKTGRILQSEEYFKKAAKRYPAGWCPNSLGLFYLRQNNVDMACQVFKEYKRYQPEYNYIYYIADHFVKTGSPEKAMDVINKVEEESPRNILQCRSILAKSYASKGLHKNAAALLEPLLLKENHYGLAPDYLEYCKAGKVGNPDMVLSKLRKRSFLHPYFDWNLANTYMRRGLFDEALPFLMDFMRNDKKNLQNNTRKTALIDAAVAWRICNGDGKTKKEIRSFVKDFQKDPWAVSCVLFLINYIDEKTIFAQAKTQKQYSEIFYYLGEIKNKEVKKDEALKYLLIYLETMDENKTFYHHAYDLAKQISN